MSVTMTGNLVANGSGSVTRMHNIGVEGLLTTRE